MAWLNAYFHRVQQLKPVTAYLKTDTPSAKASLADQLKASLKAFRPKAEAPAEPFPDPPSLPVAPPEERNHASID